MKLDRHEADSTRIYLGYPHAPLFRCADILYRPPLIISPVRMQSPENLRTQHPFERREDGRPRPKREVNHRLGVSIVKWPDLRLYRCHLSTLTETPPSPRHIYRNTSPTIATIIRRRVYASVCSSGWPTTTSTTKSDPTTGVRHSWCTRAPAPLLELNPLYDYPANLGKMREPKSELEPLTQSLLTSVRSVVAERCTRLHIPHRNRVFCSLCCPRLQDIASGLGSNKGQGGSGVRGLRVVSV
jgi:hypothetical protein